MSGEPRISKEDRYFIDCLREFYGYDPLYEDEVSEEQRIEKERERCRAKAKPYALWTEEEEKERKRMLARELLKRKKADAQIIQRKMPGSNRLNTILAINS